MQEMSTAETGARAPRGPAASADLEAALGFVRRSVRETPGYVPGFQPKPGTRLVKLNTNENPYPPSPRVIQAVKQAVDDTLRLYPSPRSDSLRAEAARLYGLSAAQVLCGNGSDEILSLIMRAFVSEGDTIGFHRPSYSLYPVLAALARARTVEVPLQRVASAADAGRIPVPSPRAKVFFLTTPNSPYGFAFPTEWVARLLAGFPGIVVADEAYVDFAPESSLPLLADNPRLIIVRTLSKTFSLAGMRIGFAFAHERLVEEMMKVKDSYNVSRLAQEAGRAALEDGEYLKRTRDRIVATREAFSRRLRDGGFAVPHSDANFIFAVPPAGMDAKTLSDRLLARGFLVRYFTAAEISDGLRISIGSEENMESLSKTIEEECRGG
jgi:histidinol-phosphate aminotransferase